MFPGSRHRSPLFVRLDDAYNSALWALIQHSSVVVDTRPDAFPLGPIFPGGCCNNESASRVPVYGRVGFLLGHPIREELLSALTALENRVRGVPWVVQNDKALWAPDVAECPYCKTFNYSSSSSMTCRCCGKMYGRNP